MIYSGALGGTITEIGAYLAAFEPTDLNWKPVTGFMIGCEFFNCYTAAGNLNDFSDDYLDSSTTEGEESFLGSFV